MPAKTRKRIIKAPPAKTGPELPDIFINFSPRIGVHYQYGERDMGWQPLVMARRRGWQLDYEFADGPYSMREVFSEENTARVEAIVLADLRRGMASGTIKVNYGRVQWWVKTLAEYEASY
jgi:hypothetical protein